MVVCSIQQLLEWKKYVYDDIGGLFQMTLY